MKKTNETSNVLKILCKKHEILADELMSLSNKQISLLKQRKDIEEGLVSDDSKILIDKINTQLDEIKIKKQC